MIFRILIPLVGLLFSPVLCSARSSMDAVYEHKVLANSSRRDTGHNILCFNTSGIKIQWNEAYGNVGGKDNRDGGGESDRGGFDADYNCVDTFIQYNYSHGNLWFCGIMKKPTRNVVIRYNITPHPSESQAIEADPRWVIGGSAGTGIDLNSMKALRAYHPRIESPCIGAGIDIEDNGGIDILKSPLGAGKPDLGAVEFVNPQWK